MVKTTNLGYQKYGAKKPYTGPDAMKDVIQASLTFDNKTILTIEQTAEHEAFIRAYILDQNAYELEQHQNSVEKNMESPDESVHSIDSEKLEKFLWSTKIEGPEKFLKLDHIQQNNDSTKYAIACQDSGNFFLIILD